MNTADKKRVEYLYKKTRYIFPAGANIFANGDKIIVEINKKKITNISRYSLKTASLNRFYMAKIGFPVTGFGSQLYKEYQAVADYFKKHNTFDFLHFDYSTSHELALCTFFKPTELNQAALIIADINKEMPFLLNIFDRPLIHLKEADIIQPVDAVKRINHNTVRHLAMHTENLKSVQNGNVSPNKLLTKVYDDDYGIYENIVFRDLIDKFLVYLRTKIYSLNEILSTFKESVQLEAINRINHPKYYLAIGKLYSGFSKTENSGEIAAVLDSASQLYDYLKKYKSRAVYANNIKVKPILGQVKKTNILSMHKDYKHVYSLYQKFNKKSGQMQGAADTEAQTRSQSGYIEFCRLLVLFAASNFNMLCRADSLLYKNGRLDAVFNHKDWILTLGEEFNPVLDFSTIVLSVSYKQNEPVRFLLVPLSYYFSSDKKRHYEHIAERLYYNGFKYDKYVFLDPFDFDSAAVNDYCLTYQTAKAVLFYASLPVSITEINSFRRIQKLLFEAMVLSDNEFKSCAFCGEDLIKECDNKYLCRRCRTAVKTLCCCGCGKNFRATDIDVLAKTKLRKKEGREDAALKDLPEFYKQEKRYSFRNITNMSESDFICPHCGAKNKNTNPKNNGIKTAGG